MGYGILLAVWLFLAAYLFGAGIEKKQQRQENEKAKARKEELKMYVFHVIKHPKDVDKLFLLSMLDSFDASDKILTDRVLNLIFFSEEEEAKNTNQPD